MKFKPMEIWASTVIMEVSFFISRMFGFGKQREENVWSGME